jgi:hypothetical protein
MKIADTVGQGMGRISGDQEEGALGGPAGIVQGGGRGAGGLSDPPLTAEEYQSELGIL